MNEIKCAGNFLYQYQEADGTVAIAKKAVLSNLAGQLEVNKKMSGIAESTGLYCDMIYGGTLYVGVIFKAIPEDKLIDVLEQS